MTHPPVDTLRRETVLADAPGALAAVLEPLVLELAGPGAALVSLALDFGEAAPAGAAVTAEGWVGRATRTLVFANARVLARDGALLAAASAVLKRP